MRLVLLLFVVAMAVPTGIAGSSTVAKKVTAVLDKKVSVVKWIG